jgi:hypothetical protein
MAKSSRNYVDGDPGQEKRGGVNMPKILKAVHTEEVLPGCAFLWMILGVDEVTHESGHRVWVDGLSPAGGEDLRKDDAYETSEIVTGGAIARQAPNQLPGP